MAKTTTPWGPADVVERVSILQQAGKKRFASAVELLETERGERLVRIAYSTGGKSRRGPVTLRRRDVERLRAALGEHPALAEALGWPTRYLSVEREPPAATRARGPRLGGARGAAPARPERAW